MLTKLVKGIAWIFIEVFRLLLPSLLSKREKPNEVIPIGADKDTKDTIDESIEESIK